MESREYKVTGMSCGHCEMSVREEVGEIPGVESIEVSAKEGRLVVSCSESVADNTVIAAVEEAGYSATRG